jgi:hypothetical protein
MGDNGFAFVPLPSSLVVRKSTLSHRQSLSDVLGHDSPQ